MVSLAVRNKWAGRACKDISNAASSAFWFQVLGCFWSIRASCLSPTIHKTWWSRIVYGARMSLPRDRMLKVKEFFQNRTPELSKLQFNWTTLDSRNRFSFVVVMGQMVPMLVIGLELEILAAWILPAWSGITSFLGIHDFFVHLRPRHEYLANEGV